MNAVSILILSAILLWAAVAVYRRIRCRRTSGDACGSCALKKYCGK
ncbi:MAG: hypothetical protein IJS25_04630 [Bacteroidales bacterium]|nr:hypothetical protein [Bacteroidales bacterium]